MWVCWRDKFWVSRVHRLRRSKSCQLQVCSLVCDNVILELRILTSLSLYTRIGLQMPSFIASLLMETNWLNFLSLKTSCWKEMKICLKIKLFGRDRILDKDS
jgi:hypothetical protein